MVRYLDDSLHIALSYDECLKHTKEAVSLLESLGFTINWNKSVLIPTTRIEFLGFIFDSAQMIIELPARKQQEVSVQVRKIVSKTVHKIRAFAELQGLLISVCPAIPYGLLYTRYLAIDINQNLLISKGNYEANMCPSQYHRCSQTKDLFG